MYPVAKSSTFQFYRNKPTYLYGIDKKDRGAAVFPPILINQTYRIS